MANIYGAEAVAFARRLQGGGMEDPNGKTVAIDREITRQINAISSKMDLLTELKVSLAKIDARFDGFVVLHGKMDEKIAKLESKVDGISHDMVLMQKDVDTLKTRSDRGDSRKWSAVQMVMTPLIGLMFGAMVWLFGHVRDMETREAKLEARYADMAKRMGQDAQGGR